MIYQSENTLKEVEGKIKAEDKEKIEKAISELKEVKDSENVEEIKNKTENLTKAFYAISEQLYKEAQAQQGGAGEGKSTAEDDVVDADYEVVDEDDNKENK